MSALDDRLRWVLRPELARLAAYHVPPAVGMVKLDAMENPYTWPPAMIDEWLGCLREAALNRYPDPGADAVREALRVTADVPADADILLGNGSDELIQLILMAVAGRDAVIMAPEPTFLMYRQLAEGLGLRFVGVPLRLDDFSLDMPAMREAVAQHAPAVIFLAYPNNPTGNLYAAEEIEELLALAPGLVVVDEAYLPFAGTSFLPRVGAHDGLLVMRTLSKLGLAGLRLGYLVGAPAWIREFDKLRLPYNINILTQISAEFALSKPHVFAAQVERILAERERLYRALTALSAVRAFPSSANFILFELLSQDARAVFESLKTQGVLVKAFAAGSGPLRRCLRVTVGKPDENDRFLAALAVALDP